MDFGRGELVPYRDLLDELIELVDEDARELGCLAEVVRARDIVSGGTSADRQLATYRAAISTNRGERDALVAVVDELIADTRAGM